VSCYFTLFDDQMPSGFRQEREAVVRGYVELLARDFDVVDAESSLVTARSALVQLLTTYAVARLDLKRTTGTLDVEMEFAE